MYKRQGLYTGVLVVDLERLARGNGADQAYISQIFQFSGTKIITPSKTYDPNDEFDQEYFEFGLFMSRREYKTINRRLIRGRQSSASEGKYISSIAPYGYRRVKLEGEKGFTLEPDEKDCLLYTSTARDYLAFLFSTANRSGDSFKYEADQRKSKLPETESDETTPGMVCGGNG